MNELEKMLDLNEGEESRKNRTGAYRNIPGHYYNNTEIVGSVVKVTAAKNGRSTAVTVRTRVMGSVVTNYPTVMFFGQQAVAAAEYEEGQRVHITGQITSYDPARIKPGQSPVLHTGKTIELNSNDEIIDEEGLHSVDMIDHEDRNSFEIRGQVVAIKNDRNDVTVTIRSTSGGHVSIVEYPYMVRDKAEFFSNIRINSYVRAIGTIQTTNVVVNTIDDSDPKNVPTFVPKTKKRQFFVLLDICSA